MSKFKIRVVVMLGMFLFFSACKKHEGEGGTASLVGKVWTEDWNAAFTIKNSEYPGADQDVYIIYGDDLSYGDKVKTNYKGEFQFKYLRKGNYQVYTYSKDKTLRSASGDTAFIQSVTISAKKETVTLETFTVYN